jgi:hypothetical protein
MLSSSRSSAVGSGLATVALLVTGSLFAQEPGTTKAPSKSGSAKAKGPRDPSQKVPPYFGQIGITDEQRESIYKIQGRHQAKIDEIEKQIDEIQAQMLAECEGVLTDSQTQILAHRRNAAAEKKKNDSAEKEKAKEKEKMSKGA